MPPTNPKKEEQVLSFSFKPSQCFKCGNGRLEPGEACEPGEVGAQTCDSILGYQAKGDLSCQSNCFGFDTQACYSFFTKISARQRYSCGIKSDGEILCWGYFGRLNIDPQTPPPLGSFKDLSVGDAHACAITVGGKLECWGLNSSGQSTPPNGNDFQSVSVGKFHSCALKTDGSIDCWGANNLADIDNIPTGTGFKQIQAADRYTCVIDSQDEVLCFGIEFLGRKQAPADVKFRHISVGATHSCGILFNDSVRCWGNNGMAPLDGQAMPPTGKFKKLAASRFHTCGIDENDKIQCWGPPRFKQNNIPTESIIDISVGREHTCGLQMDNTRIWHRKLSYNPACSWPLR